MDNTEFKDGKPATPFVLSFIVFRYVCPVLINPLRYGVVEEEPSPDVSVGLVSISKLLNDLSLCNKDKYDKRTGEWVNSRFQRLCVYLKSLLNEEEIETAKLILESSVEPQKFTDEEKQEDIEILEGFFRDMNAPLESSISHRRDSKHIIAKFFAKFNSLDWKLKEEKPEYKVKEIKKFTKT